MNGGLFRHYDYNIYDYDCIWLYSIRLSMMNNNEDDDMNKVLMKAPKVKDKTPNPV